MVTKVEAPARKRKTLNRRYVKGVRQRETILLAAAKAFAANGYSATTLSEIAARAEMQTGSLYYHFESREHLVRELLKRSMMVIYNEVRRAWDSQGPEASTIDKISIGISVHFRTILENDPYLPAYNRIINEIPLDMREEFIQYPRLYARVWQDLLEQAQSEGLLRDDLDTRLTRLLLFGAITWTQIWFKPNGVNTISEISNEAKRLFFSGILK